MKFSVIIDVHVRANKWICESFHCADDDLLITFSLCHSSANHI